MVVWRLRNHKEVETLCEELSGVYDAKTIMELYNYATSEPFFFDSQVGCQDEARHVLVKVRSKTSP